MIADQVTDAVAFHGDGPVWSECWGGLRWLDMLAADILSLEADGSVARRHVATVVAAIRSRRQGGAVLGIERGFALEDADGMLTNLGELWTDERLRMNEGGCDPAGLSGRRRFAQTAGRPDGLTVDAEGGVWVALADSGQVRRYARGRAGRGGRAAGDEGHHLAFGGSGSTNSSSPRREKGSTPAPSPRPARSSAVRGVTGLPVRESAG